jgi:hypothetical protein
MNPKPLLQFESAAVHIVSVLTYRGNRGGWLEFVLLFLVPDVSMTGFVANACVGFVIYNAVHTYVGPLALGCYAVWSDQRQAFLLSLIWAAHIGLDRMLGFGLKYPTRFKDTHLNPDRHALEIANSPFGSLRQADEPALSNRRPPGR